MLSPETVEEFADVFFRDRFERYGTMQARSSFVRAFIEKAEVVEVATSIQACRDPRDDKFLDAAVSGSADYIATGDQDLLVLHPFRGIPILTPAAFPETVNL